MDRIEEDYVSFEIAKLLKEKGFDDEYTNAFYDKAGNLYFIDLLSDLSKHPNNDTDIAASTLYVAMKWLRDIHNLDIIAPPQFDNSKWTYSAIIFKLSIPCTEIRLNDNKDKKEEACEAAINYCLENLI